MKQWFLEQGWGLLAIAIPFILPNRKVYTWTRATIGKFVKVLTVKISKHPMKALFGYFLNTLAAFCSAVSDEVRGVPPESKSGIKASEYAVTPPPSNSEGA